MSSPEPASSSPPPPTASGRCSHCGEALDPLRAARVRILDEHFHYFCSTACAENFDAPAPRSKSVDRTSSTPFPGTARPPSVPLGAGLEEHGEPVAVDVELVEPEVEAPITRRTTHPPRAASRRAPIPTPLPALAPIGPLPRPTDDAPARSAGHFELQLAASAATLSILLLLALEGRTTDAVRLGLEVLAAGGLVFHVVRRNLYSDPLMVLSAVLGVLGVTLAAITTVTLPNEASATLSYAGMQLAALAVVLLLLDRLAQPLEARRRRIASTLDHPILRVQGQQSETIPVAELRPGEEIVVHAGETVPVDASIIAGSGEINPWLESTTVRSVGAGDFMYAGAKLVSGQLRAVVRWTGNDRYWMLLTNDPVRRADRSAPAVLLARRFALRLTPVAMVLATVLSVSQGLTWSTTLSYALAAAGVLLNPALVRLIELDALRTTLTALSNGIVVRSAATLDVAGKVSAAVFCARGTLLLGEPQLSTLETLGRLSEDEILALVAGAEQLAEHPIASSVLRAARARGVTPDAVRSPRAEAGLGVTALASDGRSLVVGSRGLLLRERVSVARAEQRITELEASGRTVLLVALGGHLSGILAFQDGLRAGARAAVQHLLDAGIEPILLSGDARETCEALARTIDIDHIRPEVLPAERGAEVERLRAGGAAIAVVGRSPVDDLALASASVSLALPSRGSQAGGFDIELAGDEVQKAALALRLLHQHRSNAQRVLLLVAGGGALGTLASLMLTIPAGWVPAIALGFAVSATLFSPDPPGKANGAAATP